MKKIILVFLSVFLFVIVLTVIVVQKQQNTSGGGNILTKIANKTHLVSKTKTTSEIKTFNSPEEFKQYIERSTDVEYYDNDIVSETTFNDEPMPTTGLSKTSYNSAASLDSVEFSNPVSYNKTKSRFSKTNTQVKNIDEPDIVKTDGKNIFLSYRDFGKPIFIDNIDGDFVSREEKIMPPKPRKESKGTHVINATPPGEMKILNDLDAYGDLLLSKENLVVLGKDKKIHGYSISNKKQQKKWTISLKKDTSIQTARLLNNSLFVITRTNVDYSTPCPIKPLSLNNEDVVITCNQINYPQKPVQVDAVYSIAKINVKNGKIEEKTSFVGSYQNLVYYMSPKNLYITYRNNFSRIDVAFTFMSSDYSSLPEEQKNRIKEINNYNISEESRKHEFIVLMEKYESSLPKDKRLEIENNLENEFKAFIEKNGEKLLTSTIVKASLDDLEIKKINKFPGIVLNQFSIDEYKNTLRIATTLDLPEVDSKSYVYVLDKNLDIIGSSSEMGKGERIYSVRFIDDSAYVVTFRQTDPFYVLDLKDPKNPKVTGELKIPGYSSYLHKLDKNLILGIGKDEGKVKLSLFDVSEKNSPKEVSKYIIDEYYSEAVNNHHAFLYDQKHKVFFLPGSKGGYVFTFKGNNLEMKKAVAQSGIKRALYINDYLYLIAQNNIVVINENDWQKVQDFSLGNN